MNDAGKRLLEDLTMGYVSRPNGGGLSWNENEAAARSLIGLALAEAIAAPAPDSLDAAWAEAEAALPEGWRLSGVWPIKPSGWEAGAGGNPELRGIGPTPAAALRALAAKLRGAG